MDGVREQQALLDQFNEISARFAEPMDDAEMTRLLEKQGNLQERIDALGLWELDHKIDMAMDALRLPPSDADVSKISGGERRRVALCRLLLEQPDMLLLDEPTNHLDAESVWWLERYLAEFPGTVVAVTHDRYFLDNVAGWILELYQGAGIPWEGNYSSWLEQKERRLAQEEKQASARQKTLQRELEWVRMSPARAAGQEQGPDHRATRSCARRRAADRGHRRDPDPGARASGRRGRGRARAGQGLRRPAPVREPQLLAAAGRHRRRHRAERRRQDHAVPDDHRTGAARRGHAHGRLHRAGRLRGPEPRRARPRQDGLSRRSAAGRTSSSSAAARSTRGPTARASTSAAPTSRRRSALLSGGERNRLHLAKLLKSGGNLLLLDEPTNDLDVDTLRALEEALLGFAGCAVVISHDRWFLDRIATHILAFEGNSEAVWYEGNYAEYAADLKRRKGVDADQPHRIRYKKLVH